MPRLPVARSAGGENKASANVTAMRARRWPAAFHRGYDRQRHNVENFFCRLKRYRRLSTRYEKLAITFLGFVRLAAVVDWLIH